jgi:hypothetical protein
MRSFFVIEDFEFLAEDIHKRLGVLFDVVDHQDLAFRASRIGQLDKLWRLLDHP